MVKQENVEERYHYWLIIAKTVYKVVIIIIRNNRKKLEKCPKKKGKVQVDLELTLFLFLSPLFGIVFLKTYHILKKKRMLITNKR
jgi:hypothetical protein